MSLALMLRVEQCHKLLLYMCIKHSAINLCISYQSQSGANDLNTPALAAPRPPWFPLAWSFVRV